MLIELGPALVAPQKSPTETFASARFRETVFSVTGTWGAQTFVVSAIR
jgi:hypothetical protein